MIQIINFAENMQQRYEVQRGGGGAFNSLRYQQVRDSQPEEVYYNQQAARQKINLKDFETFEPREDAIDEASNTSSIVVPIEVQKRFDRDIHLLLDDLDMPNQTLSSLSQSQWQGRSARSNLSGLSQNQIGLGAHQSSVELSQLPSARQQDSNSNLTMSNSQYGTEEKHFDRHDDSPDFNRQNEVISVTDELTVSKSDLTDYPGGGKSYRDDKSDDVVQRPILRNQNRTFADSVLDHQPNNHNLKVGAFSDIKSGSISKTAMMLGPSRTEDTRHLGLQNKPITTAYNDSSRHIVDENALSQSDEISDLDLLTRTQISNNLQGIDPNARSKIIIPQLLDSLSQSQITSSDPSQPPTKRAQNNIFKKMVDDASSLNFTPDKDSAAFSSNSINWQFKSNNNVKEMMIHADSSESAASQLNTDRAASQEANPISQLKERIKQSNIQKRQGSSKVRDQELYEALETDPPQMKQSTQHYYHHQRHTSVQDLRAQNQELQDQNRQLAKTCEVYQNQITELKRSQKMPSGGNNELLRMRALEAARDEIRELRVQVDDRDSRINQLEKGLLETEQAFKSEAAASESKIEALELQLEKQKIVMQGHKREADQRVHQANLQLDQAQQLLEKSKFQSQTLQQKQDATLGQLQAKLQQTESLLQQQAEDLALYEGKLASAQQENAQLSTQLHTAESDAASWRARCSEVSAELDRKVKVNHQLGINQRSDDRQVDIELRRLNEKHQHQVGKLQEEIQRLKDAPLAPSSQDNPVLAQLRQVLGSDRVVTKVESLLAEVKVAQKRIRELEMKLTSVPAEQAPSNFTKNLLHQKDVEIQNLADQLQSQQEAVWQAEQDLKVAEGEMSRLTATKQDLQGELSTLRQKLRATETQLTQFSDAKSQLTDAVLQLYDQDVRGMTAGEQLARALEVLRRKPADSTAAAASSTRVTELTNQVELLRGELQGQEQHCQNQAGIIQKLEIQIPLLKSTFLAIVEAILDSQDTSQYEREHPALVDKLTQMLQKPNLSQISECATLNNPLQDKSGKHDAFTYLNALATHKQTQTTTTEQTTTSDLAAQLSTQKSAFDMLNQQYQTELQLKTDEFEILAAQLAAERAKFQSELQAAQTDFDARLERTLARQDERLSEMESEYQTRIEQESLIVSTQRSSLKQEHSDKLGQLKAQVSSLKKEVERLKKLGQESKQKMQLEFAKEKAEIQLQHQDALAQQLKDSRQKAKEQSEKNVTLIRTEMLSKITELKNEHALKVVEYQKAAKTTEELIRTQVDHCRSEMAQTHEVQLKSQQGIIERMWRKKLEEAQSKHDRQLAETVAMLEEKLSLEISERTKQHEAEVREMQHKQQRLHQMPQQPRQQTAGTQFSPVKTAQESPHQSRQSTQSLLSQCNCASELHKQQVFIESLKYNFELELERQEQLHLADTDTKLVQAFVTFEQLVLLECEKIISAISAKQGGSDPNAKRQEINGLIKQIFAQYKPYQKELKNAFESVKMKYSQVLQSLKSKLEAKYRGQGQQHQTVSTIQIDDTAANDESDTTTTQYDSRQQIIRQSTSSSQTDAEQSTPRESTRNQAQRQSLLKDYIEYQPHLQESPMGRLAPHSHNSRGAVVVEVQKVVRDIQMLFETTKMAKFCRVLLGPQQADEASVQLSQRSNTDDQSSIVNEYRDLLNNFFKLVSKLNKASDQVCQDQEVFRLRLLNVDLKQKISSLVKEQTGVVTRGLVQDVITFYQTQTSLQNPAVKRVLDSLEQLHFQISKNQFKLNQLADLFTSEGQVNHNVREVIQKCEEFSSMDAFLESSFTNKQLMPEMISPDETAQLIATVIQKLPTIRNNNTTVQSNEDILKQALQICHEQSQVMSMPPLSRLPKAHHRLATTAQQPVGSMINANSTHRSKSTGGGAQPYNMLNMPRQMLINSGSLYQTVEPSTRYNEKSHQDHTQKVSERYVTSTQEQCSASASNMVVNPRTTREQQQYPIMSQTISHEIDDYMIEDGDSAMVAISVNPGLQPQQTSTLDEELASAQKNVNQLFEKVKKFNTLQY